VWPHRFEDLLSPSRAPLCLQALVASLATIGLVATRRVGRQALALAAIPLLGIGLDFVQGRSFGEHLHPVTAGTALIALALCCQLATEPRLIAEPSRAAGVWPLLLGALLAFQAATALLASPHLRADWTMTDGATREGRASVGFARHYDTGDFASGAMFEVAMFLRQRTRPDDRIQLYGMDPYLLALAERRSATPYVYSADLVPDAPIAGIRLRGGSRREVEAARAIAKRNAADFLERLQRANPAAFVLFDRAPFRHPVHALDELLTNVPSLGPLLRESYNEVPSLSALHVYMVAASSSAQAQTRSSLSPPRV
jgi:hypothetical protein